MKHLFQPLILTAFLLPNLCFAFFCPNNFKQIDFGMTMDQVTAACGKPDSTRVVTKQDDNAPQEWTYYLQQSVSFGGSSPPNLQGTIKTSVTFNAAGNAININVNGIGVGATTICGSSISLGSTRDQVKAACGQPVNISLLSATPGQPAQIQQIQLTEFYYANSVPPTTLIFQGGKLVDRQIRQ